MYSDINTLVRISLGSLVCLLGVFWLVHPQGIFWSDTGSAISATSLPYFSLFALHDPTIGKEVATSFIITIINNNNATAVVFWGKCIGCASME
jgi:hypothetical protein